MTKSVENNFKTKLISAKGGLRHVLNGNKQTECTTQNPNKQHLTKHLNFWNKTLKLLAGGFVCYQPSVALVCFHRYGRIKEILQKASVYKEQWMCCRLDNSLQGEMLGCSGRSFLLLSLQVVIFSAGFVQVFLDKGNFYGAN